MQFDDFDLADGRPRVLMLCHDQHLDRRVLAQARSLIEHGCKVTLVALSFGMEGSREITPDSIRLIRIGLKNIKPANSTYLAYLKRLDWIAAHGRNNKDFERQCTIVDEIRRLPVRASNFLNYCWYRASLLLRYRSWHLGDPLPFTSAFLGTARLLTADLVQVHDLPAFEAGVQLAAEKKVQLVYDAHELYPEQRSFSSIQRRVCSAAERGLIKHANLVFAVNDSIGMELSKRYGIPRPVTLLNAIDPPANFDLSSRPDLLRQKIGVSQNRKILLFQGGFSPNRNLEKLVLAMSLVRNSAVVLVMLGFGDYQKTLEQLASQRGLLGEKVFFLEAVSPQDLLQHSASADIGVIPYPHVDLNSVFCTPNKLFEFIQAGLPILANDSPELRRFVAETGFGMVAPLSTQREIASAIDIAFSAPEYDEWRRTIIQRRHEFSWQVAGSVYVGAMDPLLEAVRQSRPCGSGASLGGSSSAISVPTSIV